MKITGISCWGDSIGKGVMYDAARGRYSIFKDNIFELLKHTLSVPVENYALMGATAPHGARRMDKAQLRPGSIAIIEYGGNDCDMPWQAISEEPDGEHNPRTPVRAFWDAMQYMIGRVRAAGATPVLVTPPPLDADRYFSWIARGRNAANILRYLGDVQRIYRWQEYYADQVREIADSTGCALLNIRDGFLAQRELPNLLCADGIHPNAEGYRLINEFGLKAAGGLELE